MFGLTGGPLSESISISVLQGTKLSGFLGDKTVLLLHQPPRTSATLVLEDQLSNIGAQISIKIGGSMDSRPYRQD